MKRLGGPALVLVVLLVMGGVAAVLVVKTIADAKVREGEIKAGFWTGMADRAQSLLSQAGALALL
jgi:hypothetical protein